MKRVAIPVFQSRVSPVFDCCSRALLVDLEPGQNREVKRIEITLENLTVSERLNLLNKLRVTIVICAGISQSFHDRLIAARISPIAGVAGEVEQVLSAYMCNELDDACFYMPGYKSKL